MTESRYAHLVARLFARIDRDTATEIPGNRTEGILVVQRAIGRKRMLRRSSTFALVASVAALFVMAGAWLPRFARSHEPREVVRKDRSITVTASSGDGTIVPSSGAPVPLSTASTFVAAGSRVLVGSASGAHLALSTGTQIAVDPDSDVTLREGGSSAFFDLTKGSLVANVAKLAADERFVVHTVDTEVEVRGTSFRVSVVPFDPTCGDGTTTRVAVYEGIVVVRRGGTTEQVAKGEEWPKGCTHVDPASPDSPLAPPTAKPPESGRPRKSSPPEPSLLARENNDFAEAMLARRSADKSHAIATLDRFLAKHPTSHLAEDACAERMELLSTMDHARAAAAARQYLAKYPTGFARRTAEDILASAP
jgi:hypothetical protein